MKTALKLSVIALSVALAACSSSDDKTEEVTQGEIYGPYSTGSISESSFVYFDLDTGATVDLTAEQAATDTVWDIAFKRTSVVLNANNADAPVSVYDTGNNADFWDADGKAVVASFTAATPDSELQDYLDVTAENIPSDDTMFTNDVTESILAGFYNYDFTTHAVTAAADKFYVVKHGETFSKFNVSSLVQDSMVASEITLNIAYDFGEATELALNADAECGDASHVYVDFATLSAVAADATYDVAIPCVEGDGFDYELVLADSATAYQDFANTIADADTASTYSSYGYFKTNEYTISAFSDLNWYAYGIEGNHKLWSKYGVYIVKSGDKHFKFQVTSYYDADGNSGNYSFRADELVAAQ